ncbi:hypothetical protein F5146DRAFT_493164 [Armillaria mellea]|nr:hypothetical protein F5146DRAFT_493164 [Armillaria mellea]
MSAQETSIATRSTGTVAPKEALKLRLDLNLEVEIAIQAKVNGDITLSLLFLIGLVAVDPDDCLAHCWSITFFPKTSPFHGCC